MPETSTPGSPRSADRRPPTFLGSLAWALGIAILLGAILWLGLWLFLPNDSSQVYW